MKIYCSTSRFANSQDELDYYINKICNKDLWLAVYLDDSYYKWIRAYSNGGQITFSSIYNSAWHPESYFYNIDTPGGLATNLTAQTIGLSHCEVVHPVQILSTEELIPYICGDDDNRYRFSEYFYQEDEER